MPDDYVSLWLPRTFNVRKMAGFSHLMILSDVLERATTGGLLRRVEVPQYTQVGNAVPPLLARAIVTEILNVL